MLVLGIWVYLSLTGICIMLHLANDRLKNAYELSVQSVINLIERRFSNIQINEESVEETRQPQHPLYKGSFAKCAAIQIVFEYFEPLAKLKM